MSKYFPELIKFSENEETNYIFPDGKKAEILAKLKAGVNDISLSRENVEWGIPLPWDKSQTTYVWFDALINYYSATQFVDGKKDFWPADLHLLGKEILWFHTVIWQAMLLSAKIELPKKTYTHSFYMIDGQKMSKSLGNVISPQQLVDLFGTEGGKYLIARSFPTENDSDVGINRFKEKYNADLANNLGNLISRVAKLAEGQKIIDENFEFDNEFEILINGLKLDEAFGLVFNKWIDSSNLKLNQTTPWKLDKEDQQRITVLSECISNIRKAAFHLQILMPKVAEKIEKCFKNEVKPLEESLFPRLK